MTRGFQFVPARESEQRKSDTSSAGALAEWPWTYSHRRRRKLCLLSVVLTVALTGCGTSLHSYFSNGLKLGPNSSSPPADVASAWIDAKRPEIKRGPADYGDWWRTFKDPVLDDLVRTAYLQNLNVQIAGTRVLEAQAQLAIAKGYPFPQSQTANGGFQQANLSRSVANVPPHHFFGTWSTGLAATWELDFWGKYRRSIESADSFLQASMDDYDNALVSLVGDVAATYVQYRILQQQLAYVQENIKTQQASLKIATEQWKAGQTNELGVVQGTSLLAQLEASIPLLETGMRQLNNQLCTLLGISPSDLAGKLGNASIPETPSEIPAGIPADLLRRRPDLRAAEQLIAAQTAQIGVAESELYPSFVLTGTIGYQAKDWNTWFNSSSFTGAGGPGFSWNVLNYGRLANNVRLQEYKTQELIGIYQQKVLAAEREVENGIVTYLNARREAAKLAESVKAAARAVKIANEQFAAGAIDYTPVFVAEQFLVQQQNLYAQAQGDIALGLVAVYRAVGGGWEIRHSEEANGTGSAIHVVPMEIPCK